MNYFAIGFGALALTAVGVIDYLNQASIAEETPGRFSASAYADTFGARFDNMRAARAEASLTAEQRAQRVLGGRVFLPEPPEGWTRRAWLGGDNSAIMPPVPVHQTSAASSMLDAHDAALAEAMAEQRDAQSWVYQRGDAVIAIRAEYAASDDDCNLTDWKLGDLARNGHEAGTGWAVIGGAAYRRLSPRPGPNAPFVSEAGTAYHAFEAPFGLDDMVRLSVVSTASEDDLRALLGTIDYDGLNGLLSRPVPYFGSDAPKLPKNAQAKAADALMMLQTGVVMAAGRQDDEAVKAARLGLLLAAKAARPTKATATSAPAPAAEQASADAPAKPRRLMLSGGKTCLEGSASRFCRD